ncbi:MAG: tRNA modification GTPase [Flavobacteriaceae bacterium]|nr:MAG: tRNA modification GTPase [Flavobacteriaceae bacterium]
MFFYGILTAQISYEEGFFIDNNGGEVKCLIKNMDWKYNPTNFYYKLTSLEGVKKKTITDVTVFGVVGKSEFIRTTVSIDSSSENISKLSDKREPEFKKETLFLRKLIVGKFNLYSYETGGLSRFFYNIEGEDIVQLIFKSYKTEEGNRRENNRYKQQLWNSLKCATLDKVNFQKLKYNKSSLFKLFKNYNECIDSDYLAFGKVKKGMNFKFAIKPGVNFLSLSINNSGYSNRYVEFEKSVNFRFGIEAEFVLPFNNDKWSCFVEPTYQYYKAEKELEFIKITTISKTTNVNVDYSSIDLALGVRHYMFLSKNSKLFMNLLYVFNLPLSDTIIADREDIINLEIMSDPNIAFGVGYTHNDSYSLEFRVSEKRNLLKGYASWFSDYNSSSIVFGYKF